MPTQPSPVQQRLSYGNPIQPGCNPIFRKIPLLLHHSQCDFLKNLVDRRHISRSCDDHRSQPARMMYQPGGPSWLAQFLARYSIPIIHGERIVAAGHKILLNFYAEVKISAKLRKTSVGRIRRIEKPTSLDSHGLCLISLTRRGCQFPTWSFSSVNVRGRTWLRFGNELDVPSR